MCGLRFEKTQHDVSQEINSTSENSTTVMQLNGFTQATALNLNMGYYIIRINAKAS